MKETEILLRAETAFKQAGFYTSKLCNSRPSCFDFAARRDDQLIFVKAYTNIRNASLLGSCELKAITGYLPGACIYISEKSRDRPLEDDTVYSRYGIFAVTQKTLEDMLLHKAYPLVRASPGGYYVKLNGELIRERRRKLGLSIGKISEMTGLSRRTLYGYEKNLGKASVSVAYKLEWIMGVPLVEPIDIFQAPLENKGFLDAARKFIRKHLATHPIVRKLLQLNFSVVHTKRAPFDFIAKVPKEKLRILGGIVNKKEKGVDLRAEEILSVSKVVHAQPLLITEKHIQPNSEIPIVMEEEIKKMEKPEDFIQKL